MRIYYKNNTLTLILLIKKRKKLLDGDYMNFLFWISKLNQIKLKKFNNNFYNLYFLKLKFIKIYIFLVFWIYYKINI